MEPAVSFATTEDKLEVSVDLGESWKCVGDPYGPKKVFLVLRGGASKSAATKKIARRRLSKAKSILSFDLKKLCKKYQAVSVEVTKTFKYSAVSDKGKALDEQVEEEPAFTLGCP
jgi:hypothetical protein